MPMQDYIELDLLQCRLDIIEKIVESFSSKSWELPMLKGNEEETQDMDSSEDLSTVRWKRLTPKKRKKDEDATFFDAQTPLTDVDWENVGRQEGEFLDWENFEPQGGEFDLPSSGIKDTCSTADQKLIDEETTA